MNKDGQNKTFSFVFEIDVLMIAVSILYYGFEEQYGKVVSVELDPDRKWKSLKDNEFLIPCIVTVEGGNRYSMTVDYDRDFGSLTIEYDQVEPIGA